MDAIAVMEIIGIVAFSLVGVFVGIEYELDVFGISVVSLCSSLAGGIIRDLVLGVTPPTSFLHYEYALTVIITVVVALVVFKIFDKKFTKESVLIVKKIVNIFDAIGLGVFTVTGCWAAVEIGYCDNFLVLVFVGTITAVGGGMIRDVLAGRKPIVLRKEIYALAAIAGCILFYFIHDKLNANLVTYLTAGVIVAIRILASTIKLNVRYTLTNENLKKED